MADIDDIESPLRRLPRLQPPPGGEASLRRALREAPSQARSAWPFVAAAASACMVVLLAWHMPRTRPLGTEIQQAVRRATVPKPEFQMQGARVERVGTRDADVRLYRVVALRDPAGGARAGASRRESEVED